MASSAQNQKLKQEIIGLVVVAVIAGVYFAYIGAQNAKNQSKSTSVPLATPLVTSFDTNALQHVDTKQTYPNVSPTAPELGKSDPFAK